MNNNDFFVLNKDKAMNFMRDSEFLRIDKWIARKLGIHAASILAELKNQYDLMKSMGALKNDNDEFDSESGKWFPFSISQLEDQTTLKTKEQDFAIKKLVEKDLIEVKRMGLPAERYFALK